MSLIDFDVNVIGEITKYLHPIYRKRLKITCSNLCKKIDMIEEIQKEEKVKYSGKEMMNIGIKERDLGLCKKGIRMGVKAEDIHKAMVKMEYMFRGLCDEERKIYERFKRMIHKMTQMNVIMNICGDKTISIRMSSMCSIGDIKGKLHDRPVSILFMMDIESIVIMYETEELNDDVRLYEIPSVRGYRGYSGSEFNSKSKIKLKVGYDIKVMPRRTDWRWDMYGSDKTRWESIKALFD